MKDVFPGFCSSYLVLVKIVFSLSVGTEPIENRENVDFIFIFENPIKTILLIQKISIAKSTISSNKQNPLFCSVTFFQQNGT